MTIYFAAPWARRAEALNMARIMTMHGLTVKSRWLTLHVETIDATVLHDEAIQDIRDLDTADVLFLWNPELSEGKAFEQGVAYQQCKPIVALGAPSMIFHHLTTYTWTSTLAEAITVLKRLSIAMNS